MAINIERILFINYVTHFGLLVLSLYYLYKQVLISAITTRYIYLVDFFWQNLIALVSNNVLKSRIVEAENRGLREYRFVSTNTHLKNIIRRIVKWKIGLEPEHSVCSQ